MHKYKGIVFDLDGTLINSLEDLIDSCNTVMAQHGFPTYAYEDGKKLIGRGLRNLTRDAMPEKYRSDDAFVDELTDLLRAEYSVNYLKKTKPYPEITKVLDYLKTNRIPYGVCTNKPDSEAKSLIQILFKEYDFVDVVGFTSDDLRKPNPTTTLALAKKMGVNPEECLYVGDSMVDYETGTNAGMLPVLCTWGFESPEVISKFEDAFWIDNPMRIIEALRDGKEVYSV
ncbi:HAD-IA family hydrolase [Acetobacterium paludosum]|uniref:HAD-IA family hydrolase n=1 Tax=Acetobacterium paludosum TaxID=52693 RepID=A0A923KSA9_9FIRM|nr:HAD family hydrolase [Acetobacterium paludosum]MBC3888172.1 HAD-IA family hydrolase [Acetobacterium paludosum]